MWLWFCIFAVFIMKFLPPSYIRTWFFRCLFALMFMSFCRILFILYLFPYLKAAPIAQLPFVMLSGVLFDVQAIVYLLGPFHLISLIPYRNGTRKRELLIKICFTVGLGSGILLNFIDLEFFKIKTRRSGIELFQLLSDRSNPVFSYIVNYWWLLLIYLGSIWALIRFYPRASADIRPVRPLRILFLFLFCAGLLFLGARGGLSVKPLRSFDAARYVDPLWVSATINSPTQLLTSYSSSIPKAQAYMSASEATAIAAPFQTARPYFKPGFKPNVVLIILESIGRDYCGFLNKEKRFTPFLDSLAEHAMVFPNAYSSGTTSMESLPAIFTSMPSLLEVPYINSNFQNNTLHGIHHYLPRSGYDCSFYYGAANGSMGFDNFLNITGKINYYGKQEYKGPASDDDGSWGIWDAPYLNYYAGELNEKREPFFSTVFTLTSHDPYAIPAEYRNLFKGGELPIYKAVQYTDHALRLFFKKAAASAWFKNTVFIITADHPSHSVNEYFYTPTGKYEIPLMLYAPYLIPAARADSMTASHPDLLPTIMSLTGNKERFFAFGHNLLETGNRPAIHKDYGIAQLIQYPYCLRLFPDGRFKMHVQTKYTPNKLIRYNLTSDEQLLQKQMERALKARLQIYYNGLLDNACYAK